MICALGRAFIQFHLVDACHDVKGKIKTMAQEFFAEIAAKRQELEQAAQLAVQLARQAGADECEAVIGAARGIEVSTRHQSVENVEFNQDRSLGVVVFKGKRRGSASTTDLSPSSIAESINAALGLARDTDPDPYAGLCDKELLCTKADDFDLLQELHASPDEGIQMAAATEEAALSVGDKRIKDSDGAYFASEVRTRVIATSADFCISNVSTSHSFGLTLIGQEEDRMQRGSGFGLACKYEDLPPINTVAHEALERTCGRLGAFKPKSGRYNIIFTDNAARSLWGHLKEAISGYNIYLKSSFMCDKLGQQILPDFITLHEEPLLRGKLGSRCCDGEGAACYAQDWVQAGVLQEYLLSSYTARRLQMKTNAHSGGFATLMVQSDAAHTRTLPEMMREVGEGLVIDSLMGQGVDIVSGNYSRGASGFYFKNGERVQAVHELTVAADLKELYAQIALLGNDYDPRYKLLSGSILVPDLTVSGA